MDSMITAAARALAAGDPLGALKRVALRDDAPALALRGIAMAQLGDFVRARALVRAHRGRLDPKRRWPEPDVPSQKLKLLWRRATCTGHKRRSMPRA